MEATDLDQRVERGIAWADAHDLDHTWWTEERLDLPKLNVGGYFECVLGQTGLFEQWIDFSKAEMSQNRYPTWTSYGFYGGASEWPSLNQRWRERLQQLRTERGSP